ncbi:MAG: YchJ family protein [Pseudobdellovibrionaceae bacterium]
MKLCPCDSREIFELCCGPLLANAKKAGSSQELMRSRYTAFFLKKMDYIEQTTDPETRSEIDWEANRKWAAHSRFTKLEVLKSFEEGNSGTVEFRAHFSFNNEPHIHHELSTFRKYQGTWYFRSGEMKPS